VNVAVRRALEAALGAKIERVTPVSGGDINEAYRVALSDGRAVFAKTNANGAASMFPAEARGLAWLAEARTLRVPEVVAVSGESGASFLALDFVESAPRVRNFDERLGQGLAALHRFGAPSFGLESDNFIGRLSQSNRRHETWVEFYREERLGRELERAHRSGLVSTRTRRAFDALFVRLNELVGPAEPASRLHGDLWGGNLHVDGAGEPMLVDPACYGGHREMDLAMMRLFGGFSEACFSAYEAAYALSPGHEERVPLYQLYPLLVHVNLFGGSYVGAVERALATYA
jgi:protein-ribulosamine 3-kinase